MIRCLDLVNQYFHTKLLRYYLVIRLGMLDVRTSLKASIDLRASICWLSAIAPPSLAHSIGCSIVQYPYTLPEFSGIPGS